MEPVRPVTRPRTRQLVPGGSVRIVGPSPGRTCRASHAPRSCRTARMSGRERQDRDELTPTERQVAELVASGKTNREVAQELFVTVRTVAANLTRSYAKLGVRSRVELAARR
jgi:DNA-binding CsgD family transcriptional regulator